MATTSRLGLTLINGSDYVNPDTINDNFKKVDEIAVDYVVASGKSSIWRYQKWKSGKYECWGVTQTQTHDFTTKYGNAYYPGFSFNTPTFPVKFAETPVVIPSVSRYIRDGSGFETGIWDAFVCSVTNTGANYIVTSETSEKNVSVVMGFYIVGYVTS